MFFREEGSFAKDSSPNFFKKEQKGFQPYKSQRILKKPVGKVVEKIDDDDDSLSLGDDN